MRPHVTHEVLNQPPPLTDYDVADDSAVWAALAREGADWAAGELHELGRLAGSSETATLARLASTHRTSRPGSARCSPRPSTSRVSRRQTERRACSPGWR